MNKPLHSWRFFRAGGFDQPRIDTPDDLLAIDQLDQKLWVALSCPVTGIEFDRRTLDLIDSDGDSHIRAPELIAAVQWAGARLANHQALANGVLTLAAIRDDDSEGAAIAAAALELLAGGGEVIDVDTASAAQARFAEKAVAAWEAAGASAQVLGAGTESAHASLLAVVAKIDDYFTRCRLAAFDARAADMLNASEDTLKLLAGAELSSGSAAVAALPIAKVDAGRTLLPLGDALNPAWATAMAAFQAQVVTPLLGARDNLSVADWQAVQDAFAPYVAWLAAKPDAGAAGDGVLALERLARYCRDLMRLANNFVAFKDFYTRLGPATFQIGTLYLDGRACELVVAVNDTAKHAALASLSRLCLVYCDCVRKGEGGDQKQTIAAAFTAGDADQLIVGRNGVFYDRQGRDWDATITKITDHPISLHQAFWSPYKKLARLVAEQLHKFAASKASAVEGKLAAATADASSKLAAPPAKPAVPTPFDVGKFAGIFAAIGLAVGALGTALASVVTGLLGLKWWQLPIAIAGLLLAISGPAVIVAWFKLHARNLGPLLDANGWAVNARARINIPFGTSLTQLAALPAGAERALTDPYAEKPLPWRLITVILFLLAAALLGGLAFIAR